MTLGPATADQLVVNIDDLGMNVGANLAFEHLAREKRCDSGSAMVPCPWFSDLVERVQADNRLRIGIHLTLNAEKKHYRWRPLTGSRATGGLVDADGYFWRSVRETRTHAEPAAVEAECRAQIEAFLATGIRPSHVDTHMGAMLAPEFVDILVRLAAEYDLVPLIPASLKAYGVNHNLSDCPEDTLGHAVETARLNGWPVADRVLETPWHRNGSAGERYGALLANAGPGLTVLALHANAPGEIELIEPGSAGIRTDEYEFLASRPFADWLERQPGHRSVLSDLATNQPGNRSN